MQSASVFLNVVKAPVIEAAALSEQCNNDDFPLKVDLTLGGKVSSSLSLVFRNFHGKAVKLPVVKKMEIQMANDESLNKDYLPIVGRDSFCESGVRLVLGNEHPAYVSKTVCLPDFYFTKLKAAGVQTIGGSGAVFLAARFLNRFLGYKTAYISKPSWRKFHKPQFPT